jgi:hypothetical protein
MSTSGNTGATALTDSQKIDAIYQKFVADAPRAPQAAGPGITPAPPPFDDFWTDPTPEETAAFCAEFGTTPEAIAFEVLPATHPLPTLPATTDVDVAKKYAKFGFAATGQQMLQTDVEAKRASTYAKRIFDCKTAAEMADIMPGAQYADTDAVLYGLKTATGASFGPNGEPRFGGKALTIPDLIVMQYTTSTRKVGDPGIGIAGL